MNDKLQQLYNLYKKTGLIKTTDFQTFSSADENQRRKLYELGKQKGLFVTTNYETFNTAFTPVVKKKEVSVSPSAQKQKPISSATPKKEAPKPLATSALKGIEKAKTQPKEIKAVSAAAASAVKGVEQQPKYTKPEILFPAQKGKRNDIFFDEETGETYRLDTSTETPSWKSYSSSVVKGQGGSKQDYDIYNTDVTDPKKVIELNKKFKKSVSSSEALERKSIENLALIASKYVSKSEEEAVEDLKKKFSGDNDIFDFEETGFGDMLKVTNKKTNQSITVDLDGSENEQNILKSFIQSNLEFKKYNNLIEKRNTLISSLKNSAGFNEIEIRKQISELDKEIKEQEFYRKGYALSKGSAMSTAMFGDVKEKDILKNFNNNVSRAIANKVVAKEEFKQIKEYEDKLKADYSSGKITKEQYDKSINSQELSLRKEELNKLYSNISEDVFSALEDRDLMEKVVMESMVSKSQRGDALSNLMANFMYGFTSTTRFLLDIDKYKDTPVYDIEGNRIYSTDVMSKEDFQEILPGIITEEYISSKDRSDLEKAMAGIAESIGAAASLPVGGFATNTVKTEVAKRTGVEIMKSIAKKALLTPEQIALFASSYMNFKDQINSDPESAAIDEADKVLMSGAYAYVSSKLESLGMSKWFSKGASGTKVTSWIAKNTFKDLPKDASQELIDKRINDSFRMLLAKGAISLTAKGNVEGVTEAFQELADVTVKQVYDVLSGQDVFKNPSFGDLVSQMGESYKLGLLGGTVMSTTSQALSTAREIRTSKQIKAIEDIAKDPVIKKLFEDDIKSKILSGDMTIEQAKAEMNELNESLSIIEKIPGNVTEKAESFKLISEKEKLQSEISGKDANLVKPQLDRIAEIDNQLKKIGEDAVKESKQPVEEVTAEGGGIQYQGAQEGQPEVGQREGAVGETTQPETDLGNRPVEGRSAEEARVEAKNTREIINRPATLSEYAGKKFDSPLNGDVYVEGQRVIFEDRNSNRVYDLGNIDEVMDTQLPGLAVEQERIGITPEGKVSIEGNNWNIQSELPTQGIEYNPAGEVLAVSLKDDTGNTKMFKGQDAVDIAYQIELQKYQSPEQQQFINDLLEQDEEFQAATENIKPTEVAAVVEEKATTDTAQVKPTAVEEQQKQLEIDAKQSEFNSIRLEVIKKAEELEAKGLTNEEIQSNPEFLSIRDRMDAVDAELDALESSVSDTEAKKADIEAKYNKIIEEEGLDILAPITLDEKGLSPKEIEEVRKKQAEQLERDKRLAELNQQKQKELAALEQPTTATVEQPTVKAKSLDDEVSELEEFLGKKTPKFQKGEQGVVDFNDVDNVTEEINQMPEDSANFDVPSNLSTKKKINIKSLIERFSEKLKSIKNGGVIKDISKFNGIPFIFTISDQLSSGKLKNAFTGNTIDVNGGLGFSLTDGNENNAWANTTSSEAEKTLSRAKEVYRKNKDLFDRLWAEGVLPNGHVPMAVVKMGQESIMTNEALFRFASDTIKKKFSKADRTNSLNGLIEDIVDFEIDSENRRRKKSDKKLMSDEEIDSMSKSVMSSDNVINFIKENNFKTIDELLDNINKLTPISSRAKISKILFTGNVDNKTNPEVGKITKKSALALVGNKDKSFRKYIHINTINEFIREEATKDIPKNHIIAIVGVDVINGKVTSSKNGEVTHRNYPYGVKGKLIGVLENPVNVADVFAEAYARVFVMNKPNKSGVFPSAKTTVDQAVASSGAIASMKTLRGAKLSSKITDLQKLLAKMRIAFPSVSVFETQEEFNKAIQNPNVNKFIKKGDVVYGFTIDGKIYLNPEKANSNTAIHEFSHVWMGFLRENNPELLRKGFSLLEGTDILRKKIKEFGDTDLAREEAMADIIASRGEVIIEASKKSKFKNWLNAAFRYIKSNFKAFDKLTPEEFQNLSLNEFVDGSLSVLIGGKEITEKDIKSIQVMFSKVNKIDEIISIARDNGFSDAAIKKYLEKSGFEQKDINAAMKQRKAPSTAKILGKPAPKKVTVNEATALKDQLKLEARAAREADMDLKRKQRSLVAYINGLKRQGLISVSQAVSIAKRIVMTNVNNPVMVSRMLDYAERVFKDAEYRNKLSKANSNRKRIKASIKNSSLQGTVVSVAKEFSSIDPRLIDDIDVYNSYADVVLDAVGRKSLPDTRTAMNFSAILDYTDRAKAEMEKYRLNEVKKLNDQLLDSINTAGMTSLELMDLIKSISDVDVELPSEKKRIITLDYINKVKDTYAPIVESIAKGIDPFTGESIETSKKAKELIEKLIDIDINELDIREAVKIIDAIQNFITNGITDNVEAIVESYQGDKNAKEVASKNMPVAKARLKSISKLWQQRMMSLPLLTEWIFKTPKRAVYVLEKMGISDFVNGVSKATKQWTRIIDSYYNEFNNKKANGKNFMDAENIYERNMYADLKRTVAKDEKAQKEELNRKIKLLNKSVEVLRTLGDDTNRKMADMYQKLIDKLGLNEEGVTIESIESKVDDVNKSAVNWWINTWATIYSDLDDVSKNVYNTVLEKELYYTPMKFSSLSTGVSQQVEQEAERLGGGSFATAMNYVYDKKSGSLMPSTKPADMETGRYVNLNFDMNNSTALKAALIDINTAGATRRIKSFLKSKSFTSIIPDKDERDLFENRVAGYVTASRNKSTPPDDRDLGELERSLRLWATLGATRALGGITQPLKQTVPVLTNTLLNVGRNFSLISSKAEWKWIDEIGMPISNRGQESLAAFESAESKLENNIAMSKLSSALKGVENINSRWLKWMLAKPDIYAARSSFIAYYKQALRAKGKSTKIDFNNPSDVDQEALNYAQHMIDKQQNVSDIEQMGTLFSSKSPSMKIIKNVIFPFMSFSINQKSRVITDMRRFSAKGVSIQDRTDALKSLFATSTEMAIFHTMSFLIGQFVVRGIASALGYGEDEEEDEKYKKRRLGYIISSASKDVLSPVPLTDYFAEGFADWVLSKAKIGASDDDAKKALDAFNQMRELKGKEPYIGDKATQWINNYIEENRVAVKSFDNEIPGGMYSITMSQFKDLYDSYTLAFEGKYDIEGFQGKPITKYVSKQSQEELKNIFYYQMAQKMVGFPIEAGSIMKKIEKSIKTKGSLTEKQKQTEEDLLKELGKEKLNDLELSLIKKFKSTEKTNAADKIINELNWINKNGGLKNERQVKAAIKFYDTSNTMYSSNLKEIQKLK